MFTPTPRKTGKDDETLRDATSTPLPQAAMAQAQGAAQDWEGVGGAGVALPVRRAAAAQAQTEAIPSLSDLGGADFTAAAATTKLILTPLLNKACSELIDVEESVLAMRTMQFVKKHFLFSPSGHYDPDGGAYSEERFVVAHPEGVRAFSSCQDGRQPSRQVAVLVATEHVEALQTFYESHGFNTVVTSGKKKTPFNAVFAVPAAFSNRRKTNIVPAEVVRGIRLQLPNKTIGVLFDRDRFPGKRLYAVMLDETEFQELEVEGGVQLLGDECFDAVPYTPRTGIHTIFLHTGLSAVEAVESDCLPDLAGWLGIPVSQVNVSLVPGNIIARSFKIFEITFPYSLDAYDQAHELTQRKVIRLVNPRRPHLGGFAAQFTASLPEMQALLGGRVLLPPRVGADDDDDDDDEASLPPVIPRALLEGEEV